MTYRELLEHLQSLQEYQLDKDVYVEVLRDGSMVEVRSAVIDFCLVDISDQDKHERLIPCLFEV